MFEIDAFFPPKDRTALALKLNALIASPSFAAVERGRAARHRRRCSSPPDGKPRAAIVYLAHLSDEERMFVTTLVFGKLVTWMRGQSGTTDLRALAYMDEVAGYVPPTAAPPAKKPILTILKQGRAFGLGLVLSTQNPVDLDYKAMSNAGTWLVGRLQTENDKARVLEGLRSAAGGADIAALDTAIGALQKRQFMLVSAKDSDAEGVRDALGDVLPAWAADEGAGATLMQDVARPAAAPAPAPARPAHRAWFRAGRCGCGDRRACTRRDLGRPRGASRCRPSPTSIRPRRGVRRSARQPDRPACSAFIATRVALRYDDTAAGIDEQQEFEALYGPLDGGLDLDCRNGGRLRRPRLPARRTCGRDLRAPARPRSARRSSSPRAAKDVQARLVANRSLELFRNKELKLTSRPGESARTHSSRAATRPGRRRPTRRPRSSRTAWRRRRTGSRTRSSSPSGASRRSTPRTKSRQANTMIAGAGAVLGALFGGKRNARSIANAVGSVASKARQTATSSQRKQTAEAKVAADDRRPGRSSSRRSSTR